LYRAAGVDLLLASIPRLEDRRSLCLGASTAATGSGDLALREAPRRIISTPYHGQIS
jgi:hypothetical protein